MRGSVSSAVMVAGVAGVMVAQMVIWFLSLR